MPWIGKNNLILGWPDGPADGDGRMDPRIQPDGPTVTRMDQVGWTIACRKDSQITLDRPADYTYICRIHDTSTDASDLYIFVRVGKMAGRDSDLQLENNYISYIQFLHYYIITISNGLTRTFVGSGRAKIYP